MASRRAAKHNPSENVSEETLKQDLLELEKGMREHRSLLDALAETRAAIHAGVSESQKTDEFLRRISNQEWAVRSKLLARHRLMPNAWSMFVGILRHYKLATKDRSVAQEASRFFHRGKVPSPRYQRGTDFGAAKAWFDLFEKETLLIEKYAALAKKILDAGGWTGDGEEGKLRAGPFLLINSGGFGDKDMQTVADAVERAASQMEAKGLGMACYGEVQVVGRVGSANQVAHYVSDTDIFMIRVMKRQESDYVRNAVHELAHRLAAKFMGIEGHRAMRKAYVHANTQRFLSKYDEPTAVPEIGEVLTERGKRYSVQKIVGDRIFLLKEGELPDPRKQSFMTLASYARVKQRLEGKVPAKGFVTRYAGRDEEENFCELVSFYCEDSLPPEQVAVLKPILDTVQGSVASENPAMDKKLATYEGWDERPLARFDDLVVIKQGHWIFLAHKLGLQIGKPWTNRAYAADKAKFFLKEPKGVTLLGKALIAWGEGRRDDPSLRDVEEDESYNLWAWGRRLAKASKTLRT